MEVSKIIAIFMKRNDGTIAKTYRLTGKAGKRALHTISAGRVDRFLPYKKNISKNPLPVQKP